MTFENDIFDTLIEGVFKMSPEEFDREMIAKHRKKTDELLRKYELADPWNFIRRAYLLNRIGECTRKIEFYRQDLKARQTERRVQPDIA